MVTNSQPWDNLKFDLGGIAEVQRKFFGTLFNTYAFFALYGNIDGFTYNEPEVPVSERHELDRWILSELNSLIKSVDEYYNDYEPTKAGRAIADFVDEHLSNWYVRLSRRRFWKGDYSKDKISAYQTLYTCLESLARLSAPIAPFFMERLFVDLNNVTGKSKMESVHHSEFPKPDLDLIDKALEERMEMAQKISSMVLSLRKKTNIRVRQPLNKILIPSAGEGITEQIEAVKNLILSEVNVKELEYITDTSAILVKRIKPDFKKLGPKYGKLMKQIAESVTNFTREDISALESEGRFNLKFNGQDVELTLNDVEIISEDIPGWLVANMGNLTVALDITITPRLWEEGIARELINRIQNLRKEKGFEVTDKINVELQRNDSIDQAIKNNLSYICSETLSQSFVLVDEMNSPDKGFIELTDVISTNISIRKIE
jgi:isoleucyl-tRNA synthetase